LKTKPRKDDYKDWSVVIEEHGRDLAHKVYIESLDQGKRITYGQMNEYCNRVAGFLREKRVKVNDRVTLIGKNSIETMVLYYGILKHGAVVNPVFFEESEENLYRIVNMVKPKLIFCDRDLQLDAGRYTCEWIRFSDNPQKTSGDDIFSLLEKYDPASFECIAGRKDIALIVYTSGTMTLPKGIHISREGLFYMVDEIADRTGMTEEDRVLEYRAYNWASAQLLTILSTMLKGATLYLARRFSRSRFPDWLKKYKITISSGVPAVINMLINEPVPLRKEDVPHLKFITSSSAPLGVESHLKFEEIYNIPIQQMMGMSEAGWMAGNPPAKRKIGSVGLPLRHKEICFLNEQGKQCRPGEVGEMIVKGRAMGLCYSKEDGTIENFPREGFPTGDLGYMDEDGYIYITGRKKDLIIRGGINISPMEITSRIMEHPAVRDAATIGVPDKIYGEEVASFVVTKEGFQACAEDIIVHCSRTLPDFKTPKKIVFVPALPRNQRGKLAKSDLLKLFEQQS